MYTLPTPLCFCRCSLSQQWVFDTFKFNVTKKQLLHCLKRLGFVWGRAKKGYLQKYTSADVLLLIFSSSLTIAFPLTRRFTTRGWNLLKISPSSFVMAACQSIWMSLTMPSTMGLIGLGLIPLMVLSFIFSPPI